MYGLILENLAEYIRQVYGEDRWEEIRRQASVDQPSFSVHQVYPENLIPRLAKKAIQVCYFLLITSSIFKKSYYFAKIEYKMFHLVLSKLSLPVDIKYFLKCIVTEQCSQHSFDVVFNTIIIFDRSI